MSIELGSWLLETVCCLLMCGIIWYVQCCHYPLFHHVGGDDFAAYETAYTARAGKLIAPIMLLEAGASATLAWKNFQMGNLISAHFFALLLLGVVWASTFIIQVPLHHRLHRAKCSKTIRQLVNTNWIRTISWSMRAGLLLSIAPLPHHA